MKKAFFSGLALLIFSANINAAPIKYRKVFLTCSNPGSHQDVAKTPIITNSTRHPISATTKVYWTATDGDKGFLNGPFDVNQSRTALGAPGNAYQCSAFYLVPLY